MARGRPKKPRSTKRLAVLDTLGVTIGYESQLWQMADHTHSELTDEDMTWSLLYFLAENKKFVGT